MNTRVALALLAIVFIPSTLPAQTRNRPSTAPTSRQSASTPQYPTRCCYGHSTLKRVQIVYGIPGELSAEEKAAVKNHDIAFAGTCVMLGNEPTESRYCLTCGFGGGEHGWGRTSDDPDTFLQPFSILLRRFPLPKPDERTPAQYSQGVQRGVITSESLRYTTSLPIAEIKARIVRWAAYHGLPLDPPELPHIPGHRPVPSGLSITSQQQWFPPLGKKDDLPLRVAIHVTGHPELGKVDIWLDLTTSDQEGRSIDDLLRVTQAKLKAGAGDRRK